MIFRKESCRRTCRILGTALGLQALMTGCGASGKYDKSGNLTESALGLVGGAMTATRGDSSELYQPREKRTVFKKIMNLFAPTEMDLAPFGKCPVPSTAHQGTCVVEGKSMILKYPEAGCAFSETGTGFLWVGGVALTTGPFDRPPQCGSQPHVNDTTLTSLTHTFLGNLLDHPTARTSANGLQTWVFDSSAPSQLEFSDALSLNPSSGTGGWHFNVSGGGGYRREAGEGETQTLSIAVRLVGFMGSSPSGTPFLDQTYSTTDPQGSLSPLSLTSDGGDSERVILEGSLYIQHNLERYTAKMTFDHTLHQEGCCYPRGGSVNTTFFGGPNDGKQEVLTFNAATCSPGTLGQVQFTDVSGQTLMKTLTRCF